MSRINKKLEEWTSQGLISQTQQESIISYEGALPQTNWTMIGVIILAVGTVCLGVISLIAYNWHMIPNAIKLGVGFAILFMTGAAIVRSKDGHSLVIKDGLIAFFILFCFAMIGLIAQIYNLKGEEYQTGLLWSAMTVILVSTASHFLLPYFWSGIFTLSLMVGCWSWQPLKYALNAHYLFFVFLVGSLCFILRSFAKRSALYMAFQNFVIFFSIAAAFILSIDSNSSYLAKESFGKIFPHFGLGLLMISFLFFDKSIKRIYKSMGAFIICLLLLGTWLENGIAHIPTLQSVLGILCFAAWAIVFFAANQRKMYHLMFVLIAVKIFEIFVREADSLVTTGIGLIIAGSIVMLAAYGWNRKKALIESRLQEFIQ